MRICITNLLVRCGAEPDHATPIASVGVVLVLAEGRLLS
jgi:hypothetical protein